MSTGTFLLWTSLFLAGGAFISSIIYHFTKDRNFRKYAIIATIGCVGTITMAYFLLTYHFIISNFDIHYVWNHSAKNFPWYLKISGTWAGQEGSFLLWAWLIAIPLGIQELIQYLKNKKYRQYHKDTEDTDDEPIAKMEDRTYDFTRTIVIGVLLVFIILLIVKDPFDAISNHFIDITQSDGTIKPTDPRDIYPGGFGGNPMLRNFWMVIHPPLLFIGYAFITIPFAASLSYSITSDKKWTNVSLQWSRLAWLFLTLGICVGAGWAYIALGWGGYWGWDAVEVGSLVPWITLSAFLHTQLMNKRKKEYGIITPILGMVTFVLVIFATFITRSGFWKSVHAWSETEVGLILLVIMIVIVDISTIIIIRAYILRRRKRTPEESTRSIKKKWDSISMQATILIFTILTIITFIGLMFTMGGRDPKFYETRLAPFIILMLITMGVCLCWRYLGKENTTYIIAWTFLAGIACAMLLPKYLFPGEAEMFYFNYISTHHVIGFLTPFCLLAIFASVYKIIRLVNLKSIRITLKNTSPHIIHLGAAFLFIGYGVSQTMTYESSGRVKVGETLDIDEYTVKLMEIEIIEDTGDKLSQEYWDTWDVSLEIYEGDELIDKGEMNIVYSYYFKENRRTYSKVMSSDVYVKQMLLEDLYVSFNAVNDNEVEINVKTIPMMSALWAGMILFVVGITIRIIVDYFPIKKKHARKPDLKPVKKRSEPPPVKTNATEIENDYEKMLEEELKRFRS